MAYRSHTLQIMQNYFDSNDVRSRENPAALENQLLNLSAVPLENLDLRITRENSQALQTVPVNIDNQGVYYGGQVPPSAFTQVALTSVVGTKNGVNTTLSLYDDTLPVPTRINLGAPIYIPTPMMFSVIGVGDDRSKSFAVQYVQPGAFPISNKLTLWLDQIGLNEISVTLTITGTVTPKPAWFRERKKTTEVLTIDGQGAFISRNRWDSIDSIAIRGLPIGVRLRGWSMPFGLPASPDLFRPYSTPQDRDVLFPRYWQISSSENLLKEMYRAVGFTGLVSVNSYVYTDPLLGVAVEPNTYGLYTLSGTKLYYMDRREVIPMTMIDTGINIEPPFGLQIQLDITRTGTIRYIVLSGVPYSRAGNIVQYRYLMNGVSSILPDGSLGPANAGWRDGPPKSVSIPLLTTGDYLFTLQMQESTGIFTEDIVAWRNPVFTPLASIDISTMIDNPMDLAFDSYGALWVWNGVYAIPITIHYDAYVFDQDLQTVFTTDQYDSLTVT